MEYQQVHNLTESRQHIWSQSDLVFSICLFSGLSFIYVASLYAYRLYRNKRSQHPDHGSISANNNGIDIDKTQVILSSISHHRMTPVSHGFTYAYLAVGIPVRSPESNWLLSVDDSDRWWNRGWLHVFARDHLHRGRDGPKLSANLDGYLKEEASFLFSFYFWGEGLVFYNIALKYGSISLHATHFVSKHMDDKPLTDNRTRSGLGSLRIPSCVSRHVSLSLRLQVQPSLVLVSLHGRQAAQACYCRGQQHLLRTTRVSIFGSETG